MSIPTSNGSREGVSDAFIEGGRLSRIAALALPVIAANLATNAMGLVDTAMVGRLGDAALAGVGIGGQLFMLLLAILLGLAAGVQATVARRVGERRLGETGKVLNAGILLAGLVGLASMLLGYVCVPALYPLINHDPHVVRDGIAYLSMRMPSLLFIGINVAFRAYWVGVDAAKWSMVSIVVLSLANMLFNYMLIFGHFGCPALGVAGAGLGSTLATLLGLLVNVGFALALAIEWGFLKGLPVRREVMTLVSLSWPESLRQIVFCAGVVFFYVLVGQIGTTALAAFHVVISICLVAYLPITGMGLAATTLVSEALGCDDAADARRWGWLVSGLGLALLTALSLPVVAFPRQVLGVFVVDSATLRAAIIPLQIGILGHVIEGYSKILGSAMIGAGATKTVMFTGSALQWLVFLPLLGASVLLGNGLDMAMGAFIFYAIVSALVFAAIWQRGRWQAIEI